MDNLGSDLYDRDTKELNFESYEDVRRQRKEAETGAIQQRCITCPECVACNVTGLTIRAGFSVPVRIQRRNKHEDNLNVYRCPLASHCQDQSAGCAAATLDQISQGQQCTNHHTGLLCASCASGFIATENGVCEPCDEWGAWTIVFVTLLVLTAISVCCTGNSVVQLQVRTISKTWPRLRQSFNIGVGNVQVISRIGKLAAIEWSEPLRSTFGTVRKILSIDVALLPGIACWFSDMGWYATWGFKISFPPFILIIYLGYSKAAVMWAKRSMKSKLDQADVKVSPFGLRIARAYAGASAQARVGGYAFLMTYLMYPTIVASCFDMLNCRTFDAGAAFLTSDYTISCNESGGDLSVARHAMTICGVIAIVVLPVGIPAWFGYKLYINRRIIQGDNPNCIKVAIFAPLFRFCEYLCPRLCTVSQLRHTTLADPLKSLPNLGLESDTDLQMLQTSQPICTPRSFFCIRRWSSSER